MKGVEAKARDLPSANILDNADPPIFRLRLALPFIGR